jgi:hypothetical protein
MKKSTLLRSLFFTFVCSLFLSVPSGFGLSLEPNEVPAMGWQIIGTKNNLPAHTLAVAASTDSNGGDFVAIASDSNNAFNFYRLDHANPVLGWQKEGCFINADATNIQYGLGHFIVMGTNRSSNHEPVIATSSDGKQWSQNLVFAGRGCYDNAAFSEKLGMMTGKNGALATSADGVQWTETIPPNGIARKILYTNVAPLGAPLDNQFQLYVVLPPGQSAYCGFLAFHDIPVPGSLLSTDGKTWTYSIPYSLVRNQLLLYQNKTFLANDSLSKISYAYHDSINLGETDFTGLSLEDPLIPIISVSQFTSYQQHWVAVGYNLKTGEPLSLIADFSKILNNNIVFSAEFFPQSVRLVVANQYGFLAIGEDGTSYYSTPNLPPTTNDTKSNGS